MPEQPVSVDLVETVRNFAESVPNDLDAFLGFLTPDAVWEGIPLGTSYRGVNEIRTFLTDWIGAYEEYVIEPREVRDLGNGVVIAVVNQVTRLSDSSSDTRMTEPWVFVFVWTDGHVVRVVADNAVEDARAAAERLAREREPGT